MASLPLPSLCLEQTLKGANKESPCREWGSFGVTQGQRALVVCGSDQSASPSLKTMMVSTLGSWDPTFNLLILQHRAAKFRAGEQAGSPLGSSWGGGAQGEEWSWAWLGLQVGLP